MRTPHLVVAAVATVAAVMGAAIYGFSVGQTEAESAATRAARSKADRLDLEQPRVDCRQVGNSAHCSCEVSWRTNVGRSVTRWTCQADGCIGRDH